MFLTPFIRTVILVLVYIGLCESIWNKQEQFAKSEEKCKEFMKQPYFDTDMVIGKPWRIYYTWNMRLDKKCLDMTFKNASRTVVRRIWNDMYEYLEHQPNWDAATLYATMGTARHEMLLFADQGAAGSFVGVPNIVRDANMAPVKKGVPLLQFYLKLVHEGKFLIMMDCHIGVSSLSARAEPLPYRSEIGSAAAVLNLGDGAPACTHENNKDELSATE